MKRKCAAFVIASLFVFTMLGSAWAQSDEEQLKKFETDRADAVVKGDTATVEKGKPRMTTRSPTSTVKSWARPSS
jgi:hypothetical protein